MKYWKYMIFAVCVLVAISLPKFLGVYPLQMLNIIFIYMALAVSWDMLLRSGQMSLGVAGFCGIGGYTTVLCTINLGLNPLVSILIGALLAGLIALLVGYAVLHLRLLYFAIVTLAVTEIFRILVRNFDITGGPEGIILPNAIFKGDAAGTYWLMLAIAVFTIILSWVFQKTRIHFALTSTANDEIVAASSGLNIFKYLVIVFVITSAIQGMVGGAYAQIYGFVTPESSFSVNFVLLPVTMVLLGGSNSTWGPVIGAVLLSVIAEALKLVIPYGHLLVYGIIMIVAILWLPGGIYGIFKKIGAKAHN
ncbi:MAG TPA: branched-chain amino acid ABC transporter permease [Smithellaceae bacterium]|nr:branched-chain amino acid ABC transporter permease [Smithellaceae bacterium]